ncbi:MAG: HAMP domain-containing sensor histidine kinase, partial [Bacteroidales bacterium]|nr:HAMP domain-containing sensor histidine kinase [Bacteroidales bacterium]
ISGTDSLRQRINDILDIAKLEERRLVIKKEPSNLKSIIEKSMEQLGIVAARRKVQLLTNLPGSLPSIPADADRMHRVIMNLLSNALHHTPRGGRVSVTAGVTGNNLMRISVHDTGEGIPHDALERIFDKFAQVESCKTRRRSSSGLGLTFCKLVVEAHGGSIWAESKPDDGSTIHFELPLE